MSLKDCFSSCLTSGHRVRRQEMGEFVWLCLECPVMMLFGKWTINCLAHIEQIYDQKQFILTRNYLYVFRLPRIISEVEKSGLFRKSVLSNHILLRTHRWKNILQKQIHGKNVFLKQRLVKEYFVIANTCKDTCWNSINMTPQTPVVRASVWFPLAQYSLLTTSMYWLVLHRIVSSTRSNITIERNLPQIYSWGFCDFLPLQ